MKNKHKKREKIVLTAALAQKLKELWALEGINMLTDKQVAIQCGINPCTLRTWVHRNKKIEYSGCNGDTDRPLGLKDVRKLGRANIKISLLLELLKVAEQAAASSDYTTASDIYKWLLEKQYPKQFGRQSQKTSADNDDTPRLIGVRCSG
jgi:hypothetical protein